VFTFYPYPYYNFEQCGRSDAYGKQHFAMADSRFSPAKLTHCDRTNNGNYVLMGHGLIHHPLCHFVPHSSVYRHQSISPFFLDSCIIYCLLGMFLFYSLERCCWKCNNNCNILSFSISWLSDKTKVSKCIKLAIIQTAVRQVFAVSRGGFSDARCFRNN